MKKIRCQNCPKGILFAIDDKATSGKLEGKCSWCKAIYIYDLETGEYELVSKNVRENIKTQE